MIIISVVVIGLISLKRIPLLYLPEFSGSSLWIDIPYLSSSPEEIERLITIPVEDAVGTVENLESISSSSTEDRASIGLIFKLGVDMRLAALRVMNRIDEIKASLPKEIENIQIMRFQSGDLPVIEFQVAGNVETERLNSAVDKVIKRRLQRIEGVAEVEVRGVSEKRIFVELDQEQLISHNVEAYSLRNALVSSNVNLSAGNLIDEGRKYNVHVSGDFNTVREIAWLPVPITEFQNPDSSMSNPDSKIPIPKSGRLLVVKLNDLADVCYDFPKKTKYQRLDGKDAVTVSVMKTTNANTVSVANEVKNAIKELKVDPRLRGLEIDIFRDRADPVIKSLIKLRNSGIIGGILVIVVLFFFLKNILSTIIVVGAIPISILSAFCLMFILRKVFNSEITINVISLSGMMLAIGILVDPSIVVLENIFRHKSSNRLTAKEAAVTGTAEVSTAIIAATMTTVSVFTPLIFLSKNRMGIFLRDFGITVCIIVIASLFVALTLVPLMASRFLNRNRKTGTINFENPLNRNSSDKSKQLLNCYTNLVHHTLKHKWITIGIAFIIVIAAVFAFKQLDRQVIWNTPYRETRIWIDTPGNYDISDTEALFKKLENLIYTKKKEFEITTIASNFEKDGGMLEAYLKPKEEARLSLETVRERIMEILPSIPGVRYSSARKYGYGPASGNITVDLHGNKTDTLIRLANRAKRKLEEIPYIKEVDTNLQSGANEIQINVKREKAQKYGIVPQRVAFGLKGSLSSRTISSLKAEDNEVDITFQIKEEDRDTLGKLKNITIKNAENENIVIDRIALMEKRMGPKTIEREERRPTITLSMNYNETGYNKLQEDISGIMKQINLPPDYSWNLGGEYQHYSRDEKEWFSGILLAVIIIYLIMAALFESFIYPFTIMLSIPFAFTGVAFIFYLMGIPLDDFAQIGMLILSGIVVNNAIVLIDYINRLRNNGMKKEEAILKGVKDRLRPILMTSITTILGLLPMVLPMLLPQLFGQLEGREKMWAPLGVVVAGGLTTSTVLMLLILPAFYSLIDDLGQYCKGFIKIAVSI